MKPQDFTDRDFIAETAENAEEVPLHLLQYMERSSLCDLCALWDEELVSIPGLSPGQACVIVWLKFSEFSAFSG